MKSLFLFGAVFSALISSAATAQTTFEISVSNPLNTGRTDVPVVISLEGRGVVASALIQDSEGREVACQLDDLNRDETFDELCFLIDLKGKEKKTFSVTFFSEGEPRKYPARVYTEMLMRNDKVKEKNRHNNFIESITARGDCANSYNLQHHHGVSFESELNGIRIYFDKRQTLDLYGKFKKRLELQETQFYTSKEQKQEAYGDDVLWVGQTFGLGAFRGWDGKEPTMIDPVRSRTQRIVSYGPLRTIVELEDRGWKTPSIDDKDKKREALKPVNMTIRYTQYAGHRDTDVDVFFNQDVSNFRFSTGIINVKGSDEFTDHHGLRGCWGTDWPAGDTVNWNRETVGLAIWLNEQNVAREIATQKAIEQGGNYTYVVKVNGKQMHYKVAYCSANEEFGFRSKEEWFDWMKAWKQEITKPVVVKY